MSSNFVSGYCPAGCGRTLRLNVVGEVHCESPECPLPYALDEILNDSETEHVVVLYPGSFSMMHPLRERIDKELLTCGIGEHVAEFGEQYAQGGVFGDPIKLGMPYRVYFAGEGEDATVEWEPIT